MAQITAQEITDIVDKLVHLRPAKFPTLSAYVFGQGSEARYLKALAYLDEGLVKDQIRNVAFKDAKDTLNRFVDGVWEHEVDRKFFWKPDAELPEELRNFSWDIRVNGLHSVTAAFKRIEATKLEGEAITASKKLIHELQPLTDAVNGLKSKIVMGRAPNPNPKPENPDKIVRTCSCCFRQIAVQGNRMVHHGYKRPWDGGQTASCLGIRFKPLERSDEGLKALLLGTERHIESCKKQLEEKDQKKTLSYRPDVGRRAIELTPDHPLWKRKFDEWVNKLKSELYYSGEAVKDLNAKISAWKQTEIDPERPDIAIDCDATPRRAR